MWPPAYNLHWAEVVRKHSKLLPHIGFSRHAHHQKRLDSGHFLLTAIGETIPSLDSQFDLLAAIDLVVFDRG